MSCPITIDLPTSKAFEPESRFQANTYYVSLNSLLLWTRGERPPDWNAHFGRSASREVEIGFGNGEALVRRAVLEPEVDFIGLELSWNSLKRALRRISKKSVTNVRLMQADAHTAFDRLIKPRSLDRIRSWFPAPWPKDRHERRRLFSRDFLRLVNSRLKDRGFLQIVTDHKPYMDWVMDQTAETGLAASWHCTRAQYDTKYERKWRAEGKDVFYEARLIKEKHIDVPLGKDTPLFTYRLDGFNPKEFVARDLCGLPTIKFKDFIFDPQQERGLLLALVAEDRFRQDVWLEIKRDGLEWVVGLAPGNQILPTDGVKIAIDQTRRDAAATCE
jgi:tRNA (guanine-N7-)-methyltransferase